MKVWSIVLSVLLVTGLAMAQYATPGGAGLQSWTDADEYLHIPMTVAPPAIDGELDLEWYSTPVIKLLLDTGMDAVPEGTSPDDYLDCTVEARMMWDVDALYVFCKVIDDQPGEVGGDPWTNDSVELCLDGDNSKEDANDPVGHGQHRWVYGETTSAFTSDEVAWFDTDYGYNFELKIPAADLAADEFSGLAAGNEFGLEIQVNDRDNDARESLMRWWYTSNDSWTSPAMWGNAVLDPAQVSDLLPIYKTDTPFTIDGVAEAAWDAFPFFPTNTWISEGITFDFEAFESFFDDDWIDFRAAYDDEYFYAIMYKRDDVNYCPYEEGTSPHENDSVEMYWDGGNEKNPGSYDDNDIQLRWVSDGYGTGFDICESAVSLGEPRTGEEGYVVELKGTFGVDKTVELPFGPSEGDLIGFEVQTNDNDDEGDTEGRETCARWWSNDNASWADPSYFGTAEMFGLKPSAVSPEPKVAKDFALAQNYPNPFNPTTNIRYELKTAGMVRLSVYDMLGRQVATLVNEVQSEGPQVVSFDAGNMTSGVYFYKLEAGDQVFTRKMTLLK